MTLGLNYLMTFGSSEVEALHASTALWVAIAVAISVIGIGRLWLANRILRSQPT